MRNIYQESVIDFYTKVGQSSYTDVNNDINVRTITGNHVMSIAGDMLATVKGNFKYFAHGKGSFSSTMEMELHSFGSSIAIASASDVVVKAIAGNVDVHAPGESGNVNITTTKAQQSIGQDGIAATIEGAFKLNTQSAEISANAGTTIATPLGLFGIAGTSIFKVTSQDISIDAVNQIRMRTPANSHTFDEVSNKINETITAVDTLTYQTSLISDAIGVAISALSGSITIPVDFNLACLIDGLYALLPPELTSVFATLDELNAALVLLGELETKLEDIDNLLNGNIALLSDLGLPTDLNIDIDYSMAPCIDGLAEDGTPITFDDVVQFPPIPLRQLISRIYDNFAALGPPQPALPETVVPDPPIPVTPLPNQKP
jgi:hypothetical protein